MTSSESFLSFLALIGEGRLSEQDARSAIQAAELTPFVDVDRLLRWQFSKDRPTPHGGAKAGDEVESPHMPPGSNLWGSITVLGRTYGFGPKSFVLLLRGIFDLPTPLGIPRRTMAELCVEAGSRIESFPVVYSFTTALAYCLELESDRTAARRLWEPFTSLTMREWASTAFESLFIESEVDESPREFTVAERHEEQTLTSRISVSRRSGEMDRAYVSLRNLALVHAYAGHVDEALHCYDQAYSCAEGTLKTTPMLVLLGDTLWVAIRGDRKPKQRETVAALVRELESAEFLVADAAVFARSATLCHMAGDPTAEWQFVSRIPNCLR
jgi:hypothetical protein